MNNEEKSIEYHLERIKKLKKQYEEEYKKQTDLEVKRIPSKDVDSFIEPKTVMEKQKTAVDWLIEQMRLRKEQGLTISFYDLEMFADKAKQMEKEQIREAYSDGKSHGEDIASKFEWGVRVKEINSEQYYNETYGKDENKGD